MTEGEARAWLIDQFGNARFAKLESFVDNLLSANRSQNLISRASEAHIWTRHILDSAQLRRFAPGAENWLDIGSGAGLPGLVLAIVTDKPTLLVEPRRKRAEFLAEAADHLGLRNVRVRQVEIDRISGEKFAAVTARAFAPLPDIFMSTVQLTEPSTIWILPKGRAAERELAASTEAWHGVFHVEQSLTDADARIVVATDVRSR